MLIPTDNSIILYHKTIRHTEIEFRGQKYKVEIIAKTYDKDKIKTSFWIYIEGYKLKYLAHEIFNQLTDKEATKQIESNIEDWIYEMDTFTSQLK